jgi:hypothetical protein
MNKKLISLFTLVVFTVFTFSCSGYTKKISRIDKIPGYDWYEAKITAVYIASGKRIEFVGPGGGRFSGENIIGTVRDEAGLPKVVSIPISEIDLVEIKKYSAGKSLGGTVLVILAIPAFLLNQWLIGIELGWYESPSCPFIYSFDGEKYIFDAEPFAGSICRGLARTDWCPLQHVREVNGEYRLLMTNEVAETEYVDELKLVVVDHPDGIKVAPGALGGLFTFAEPRAPLRVYDRQGRDLSLHLSENDGLYWVSREKGKNPDKKEDLREELIFEFPKPENAASVKLLFKGCTTLWGSESLKRYLQMYGREVSSFYQDLKSFGPELFKVLNMGIREELYTLQIRVETGSGWQSKGMIFGGPPLVSETKAYVLDIADVPGDTLRIKLTPPALFWKIDYAAVDYSADVPIEVKEIAASAAVDEKGVDKRALLSGNDGRYVVMPDKEGEVLLTFQAPPRLAGVERTVILKAGGYYDIRLGKAVDREPQRELLRKIHWQPGFVVQDAFKEFLRWKQENRAKL